MTVATTSLIAGPFTGTGASASLPFTFKCFAATDLQVLRDGTALSYGGDYSVVLNADQNVSPGGTVNILAAANTLASIVYVVLNMVESQPTSLPSQSSWSPKVVEKALDRLSLLVMQLRAVLNRALVAPFGEVLNALPSAASRAGKYLYFDAITGQPTVIPGTSGSSVLTDGTYGDVIVSSSGTVITIGAAKVSLAKMANLAANSIIGNNTGAGATPLALTGAQVTAMLSAATGDSGSGGVKGLVPAPAAGDAAAGKYLKADMTWASPPGGGAGTTTNSVTFAASGGAAPGAVFNGSAAKTIDFSTIGAAPLASPTFTGTPAAPTAAPGTSTTQLATTAFVAASFAPLASPALTGNPTAPTPAAGDADTSIATTAFVDALRDIPSNAKTANYALALTDRGQGVDFNGTSLVCTIPANGSVPFPVGTVIVLTNLNASSLSIAITTDTLTMSGTTTTGTRTLGQNGEARLRKVGATSWLISGTALT